MPIYERGSVQIHYQEAGSGFPLLVIPGGGLNATISYLTERTPFNPMSVLADEFGRPFKRADLWHSNGLRAIYAAELKSGLILKVVTVAAHMDPPEGEREPELASVA